MTSPIGEQPDVSRKISRWKRRRSDGASFDTGATSAADSACDDDDASRHRTGETRGRRNGASFAARWRDWTNHEPLRATPEFRRRIAAASRASAASLGAFSVLVATGQEALPAAWIGNVLAQATLKATLGDTALAVRSAATPLIPVGALSWAIAAGLDACDTKAYSMLLPFVVAPGSVLLLMCPFLTSKNLMLVVFYMTVASPLASRYESGDPAGAASQIEPLSPWFAPSFVGTCFVGLSIPLVVHIFLAASPRPTTATSRVPTLLGRVSSETSQLLLGVAEFLSNIGVSSETARRAKAQINLFVHFRGNTLAELRQCVAAVKAETNMGQTICLCRQERTGDGSTNLGELHAIDGCVALLERQQTHAELLQLATTQQLMGEDFSIRSKAVRGIKTKISQLGSVVKEMASAYDEAQRSYLLAKGNERAQQDALQVLDLSLQQYRAAMKRAITEAETLLVNETIDTHMESTAAPLIRARVIFHSLYCLITELSDAIKSSTSDGTEGNTQISVWSKITPLVSAPWQWNDWAKRRVAIKSAVGLSLASLFVSIPALRENIAHPNSIWPAVTVASVTLETTGAAYQKCIDRLWGTLIAAGFCLLIDKTFPEIEHVAKILAIGFFTFAAIFLQNPKRPYACRYAASSVGSILYGSMDINVEVEGYIPNRIMLIFVGIAIFLLVECLLFPRSSRTIVQAKSLQFFEDTEQFLLEARKVVDSISMYHRDGDSNESSEKNDQEMKLLDDPLWMLRQGQKEMKSVAEGLYETAKVAQKNLSEACVELEPGINEPSIGLNVPLDADGYRALLWEQRRGHAQFQILITSIQALAGYYANLERDSPVRSLHWPLLLSSNLAKSARQLSICCDDLRLVFPAGLCRPSPGRSILATIKSISNFRSFEDVRLLSLTEWSERHGEYLDSVKSTGTAMHFAPGFRLTLALAMSSTLEIDRCLQNCGECLEQIVQSFPQNK